ncbi:tetratricopeptide repeat protein [Thiohalobacter sp.]|uniref:tetratricopeptide repeat protein n=1 Tax=Thiohalobacter sp. TaxID=2025948 RepID=UPI00262993AB|nr:tetratricopeptide repeat protein [Thiohalobacter sp.]
MTDLLRLPALLLAASLLAGCPATAPVRSTDLMDLQREAAAAYQAEQWEQALPAYQTLTRRVPRDPELWFRLGNVHARLRQPEEAVAAWQHALTLNPRDGRAWHNIGITRLRQAANAFTQMAQSLPPDDPLQPRALELAEQVLNILEPDAAAKTE